MAVANLALRFFVEVLGIAAVGYWGFNTSSDGLIRTLVAIGAALAFILVWAVVVARNRNNGLSQPQKDIMGTLILLLAAAGLGMAGQPGLASGFAVVIGVNAWLLLAAPIGSEPR